MMPFKALRMRTPSGGVPWTPANLANVPLLWNNDSGSVIDAGGGAMDERGPNRPPQTELNTTSGTARPLIVLSALNSRRGILYDGSNDYSEWDSSAANDVFKNAATGWFFVVWGRTSSGGGGSSRVLTSHGTSS